MGRSHSRLVVLSAALLTTGSVMAQGMQVYRCVGGDGAVALRDTPCEAGETQEVRWVKHPQDPPPSGGPVPDEDVSPPSAPRAPVAAEIGIVTVAPPQPLYECVTPDGDVYTSDSAEGNPRWVPLWTLGFRPGMVGPPGAELPAGAYIRDHCVLLPQREICSRLVDRRFEILRRYGTVSPGERRALDREQEVLDARIANDCRGQ